MKNSIIIKAMIRNKILYEKELEIKFNKEISYWLLCNNQLCSDNLEEKKINVFDIGDDNQFEQLNKLIIMLKDACNNEQFEIDKNKELLEDLRVARRNTSNLNDFNEFTKRYDDLNHYIKNNNNPKSEKIIQSIRDAVNSLNSYRQAHSITTSVDRALAARIENIPLDVYKIIIEF